MNRRAVTPCDRPDLEEPLLPHDRIIYKRRNRIERRFNRLKHSRRFATRYERRSIHLT
ncbi:transposase [Rhizobium leguminosarum]|nr:transposase [Rhizobium leguminosarum]MBY2952106.1 transposase [Rhizobium leguminosarum]